jgi:hypothetical protein
MEQLFLGKEKMPNKNNRKLTCHNYNSKGYCTRSNCRSLLRKLDAPGYHYKEYENQK